MRGSCVSTRVVVRRTFNSVPYPAHWFLQAQPHPETPSGHPPRGPGVDTAVDALGVCRSKEPREVRAVRQTLRPPLAQSVIYALDVFGFPAANASVSMPSISVKSPCVNVRKLGSHDAPRRLQSSRASPDYRKIIHTFNVRSGIGSGTILR